MIMRIFDHLKGLVACALCRYSEHGKYCKYPEIDYGGTSLAAIGLKEGGDQLGKLWRLGY